MSDAPSEDVTTLAATTQAQFDRKDFVAALAGYDELRRAEPGNGLYIDRYGYCFIALKRWREAETVWLAIIREHGVSKGRVGYVLQCRAETARYDEAMAFLLPHRAACAADPSFIVYHVTAALGCGKLEDAIDIFRELEAACPAAKLAAAHAQLGYRLVVLARHGHADAALAFIDRVLPSLGDPAPLLDAGARLAAAAKRWPAQIAFLDRLITLEPAAPGRYLEKASALLALGDVTGCDELLADFALRFPPGLRRGQTEQRFQGLEIRARSLGMWRKALDADRSAPTFHALAFRAAAHAALNQHPQAMDAAQSGLALYDNHPWFQFLLGKSHDALGDTARALDWLNRATSAAEPPTEFLLALLRARIKAGQTEAAAALGSRLLRRHRASDFIVGLLAQLGLPTESLPLSETAEELQGRLSWLHGGDSGDVVYALATMQAAGGGCLYLTCIDATREPMDGRKIDFLAPLLAAQRYVLSVGPWQGEPIAKDFNVMRNMMLPDLDLASMHWSAVMDSGALDVTRPWLTVPGGVRHGRPVFARSSRYRNPSWEPFWEQLKAAAPDAIFVGTTTEFDEFRHGEHYLARDALDLARIIQGGSIFVGNQSLPYAIAEGLKMGRLLESSPYVRNCLFPGALALGFG